VEAVAPRAHHRAERLGEDGAREILRGRDDGVDVETGDREARVAALDLVEEQRLADPAQAQEGDVPATAGGQAGQKTVEARELGRAVHEEGRGDNRLHRRAPGDAILIHPAVGYILTMREKMPRSRGLLPPPRCATA
jgi:hypothetical protein